MLQIAFELSNTKWKIGFATKEHNRYRAVAAGDLAGFVEELEKAKKKLGVSEDAPVLSIYEAGRDGFWIHRWLESLGIQNRIVDPASILVNRRKRRAKTDSLDTAGLLRLLQRVIDGDKKACSVIHVPSEDEEDERRGEREISRLKKEICQHKSRIKSLLVMHNVRIGLWSKFGESIEALRDWKGRPLPTRVVAEIRREHERMILAEQQLKALVKERRERIRSPQTRTEKIAHRLSLLSAIGPVGAMVLAQEFFGWREFKNVRQVGACAGLTGTPYVSGEMQVEQGISKAGNGRVRSLMLELAWCWLRYQKNSALARWYQERWGNGSKRTKRVGIVALARKLLVALWKYLTLGEVPEGAVLSIKTL